MAQFDLEFEVPEEISAEDAEQTLYWPASGRGSFRSKLLPRLGDLGPVRVENADLFRLAAMVYAADRSEPRQVGTLNWRRRDLTLIVPVTNPTLWDELRDEIEALLAFLSGDNWQIAFRGAHIPDEQIKDNPFPDARRAVLMSGGADSCIGAYLARTAPEPHILVSHVGATSVGPIQRDVAAKIRDLRPDGSNQNHKQVAFTRRQWQPGGHAFRNEYSTRTRSFLFLALGLSIASMNRVPLWIPENGFASLNPPLGPDQLGSLSTRTTHPWFLAQLSRIAGKAGAWGEIENPFASQTKGEMFRWLANDLGVGPASELLGLTNSCAYTNRRWLGVGSHDHCGTCFGCLMRRASFAAAHLPDASTYVIDSPANSGVAAQLQKSSILPSVRGFVARGIRVADVAAIRLPDGYSASDARDLCLRGLRELELCL